jgi:hypothetical protein
MATDAQRLADYLTTLGMKPERAAELSGVHVSTIYRWLAGDVRIPATALKYFAALSGMK